MIKWIFCISLFLLPFSALVWGRSNVSVTEDPWVYHALNQLVAFGLVDNAILSQKPISFSEAIRIKNQAKENLPRLAGKEIESRAWLLIKQLEEIIPQDPPQKEVRVDPLQKFRLEYLFLDSPARSAIENISGSHLDANLNPLVAYRAGRPFADGHNFQWETEHQFSFEPYFSISGQPQFFLQKLDKSSQDRMDWNFDHLYLRSEFKNIGVQIGRDQLIWGPDLLKGNIFSANARGQDMFKVDNIFPFHLPLFLKSLGWVDASFIFSTLESDRDFPHAYLTAFKLSFLPHKNFQFGFTAATMSGGKGSPPSSLGSRMVDPVFGYLLNIAGGDSPIDDFASNRIGGFDFLWRIPALRNSELYYEVTLEDVNTRYKYYLETFNRGGLHIPRLSSDGRHSARLEYNFAGFLPYRHNQFLSGWTRYRKIMGDELGPDAQAVYINYSHNPTRFWQNHLGFAYERRDSDIYRIPPIPDPVVKTVDGPAETRFRFLGGFVWKATPHFEPALDFGMERMVRFNFVSGANRNNFLTDLKLTWYPKS